MMIGHWNRLSSEVVEPLFWLYIAQATYSSWKCFKYEFGLEDFQMYLPASDILWLHDL